MLNIRTILKALKILPKASTEISAQGEMEVLTSDGKLRYHDGSSISPVVTEAHSATLTNKSIDADSNTITNIDNNDIKAAAGIVDTKLATISTAGKVSNSATTATDANTASAIVARDASGNFSAGTITAALSGNATTATTATNFSGSLAGDVSGTQGATVVDTVGGKTDTEIATSVTDTQAATSSNTVSTIVKRDASGNFSAGTITAALSGNATTATTATNVSGTVAIANGGTGQTSQTAAFDALAPTTTAGDLILHNGTNNVRFAIGSDGQVPVVDTGLTGKLKWATLPTGTKNYITYGTFENNATTGWSKLTVGAVDSTTKAVSGSVTLSAAGITTFATTATNPLAGTYSLSAGNASSALTVTEGIISDAYTIDREDQAKVLSFKFHYEAITGASNGNFSGTTSNTLAVWIYDTANSAWIQPSGSFGLTQSSGVGICQGTFQTPSNMTSFRIALVCINAPSGALVFNLDDVTVGPQVITQGTPVTDWQAYTPTFAGLGTVTGIDFKWRRVGDSIQILGAATTGTTTGSTASFTLPNGLSNNLATTFKVGSYGRVNANAEQHAMITQAADKTKLYFSIQTGSVADLFTANGNALFAPSEYFTVVTEAFPVQGWSSQVQMSSDTDTRVVAAAYQASSGQTFTSGSTTKVTFATKLFDTHSVFATDTYTVPVSGKYRVSTNFRFTPTSYSTGTNQINITLYKNGSGYGDLDLIQPGSTTTSDRMLSGSVLVDCAAGDLLDLRLFQNTGANVTGGATSQGQFFIERLSGPQQIAASETVAAHYTGSPPTGTLTNSFNVVTFGTKVDDSHGAMSGSAYTVPVSGRYSISAALTVIGTYSLNYATWVRITVNGTSKAAKFTKAGGANDVLEAMTSISSIRLTAGDIVRVESYTDASSPSFGAGTDNNFFSIVRVGNY